MERPTSQLTNAQCHDLDERIIEGLIRHEVFGQVTFGHSIDEKVRLPSFLIGAAAAVICGTITLLFILTLPNPLMKLTGGIAVLAVSCWFMYVKELGRPFNRRAREGAIKDLANGIAAELHRIEMRQPEERETIGTLLAHLEAVSETGSTEFPEEWLARKPWFEELQEKMDSSEEHRELAETWLWKSIRMTWLDPTHYTHLPRTH